MKASTSTHYHESEKQTRKRRIDKALAEVGWTIQAYEENRSLDQYDRCAIEEFPTANGPADYALCVGGRIIGVVEAKKLTIGPQNVLTQAERYSRGVDNSPFDFNGFRVPFLYSTNGEVIWHHDIRHTRSRSRRVSLFHTPSALEERLALDSEHAAEKLRALPNTHPKLRPYQIEANDAIEQAIDDQKRLMLVAMATGTGKTFMTVNQAYRLMKSGVGKRILFLVDRRALAAQAVKAFASFEAEPGLKFDKIYEVYSQRFHRDDLEGEEEFDPKTLPSSYLLDPKPGHAFVYISTIQRMAINLFGREAGMEMVDEPIDDDAEREPIPSHAFDIIIADECHRGYTSSELSIWRNTLNHFDAITVGLTATPASHTTSHFKEVVYRYDYERAVREGFLVDYDVVAITSDVRMNGVFLREGEAVGAIDTTTGAETLDLLEDERRFDTSDIESRVTAPDSNKKILEEIRRHAERHQEKYGRFPKTLIFAVNDLPHTSHADQLVDLARDVFGQGDAFVQKITGRVDRPLQRIREFRNRDLPGIVVTVDMLSTGVDIPDLEYIVFLRPVKSRILFEQMLGRGTRKGERFPDKSHFTVFDCFGGSLLHYFASATAITTDPPERESRTVEQIIEDIWQNRDREHNTRCLMKRLRRIDKEITGDGRELFAVYVPNGDIGRWAERLSELLTKEFTATMKILRDTGFQKLLHDYPRPKRQFFVGYGVEDTVTSGYLIRDGVGAEYKPEDYLTMFAEFVRTKHAEIDAIGVLLDRPQEWNPATLTELRNTLVAGPTRFTEKNLQKAHELHYHKALVDIISMIKHAASESAPLLSAEERVKVAFAAVTSGHAYTPEQRAWLDRIRDHLVVNLAVDEGDFEVVPVFTHAGGWKRANRDFDGRLAALLHDFNRAVAA